jgi:hypothetical protein
MKRSANCRPASTTPPNASQQMDPMRLCGMLLAMSVRLQFEGVRCFSEAQDAIVRPLTLLVGENSSGKSTFLALCQIASTITRGYAQEFPFNEPPLLLGAFEQVASNRGGRAGRAKSFSIGISLDDKPRASSIQAEFVSKNGQPDLCVWRMAAGGLIWQVTLNGSRDTVSLVAESAQGRHEVSNVPMHADALRFPLSFIATLSPALGFLRTLFSESDWDALSGTGLSIQQEFGHRTYALAPIRTSPQRTYDPVSSEPKPEGSHVPMLLSLLSHSAEKAQWAALKAELGEFGSKSGLFEEIEIIRKGKKESDPFQIGVKSGGPTFNLVDVGYGVSQALPILVDILQRPAANEVFLLQQPEVHLHPRAQAELGSFFARQAGKKRRFVVETHSDYLVDRVRMEVRRGTLKPDDVSLLYFERQKHGAMIHNLELDKKGSITNAPDGFRQFFLDEENELLGI